MGSGDHRYAIILAGGEGTRFVPYSTPDRPKQFLHITDSNRTMIQHTFDRINRFIPAERIFVSTNDRYVDLVGEQLPEIPRGNIIGEPKKKNTAPAIALLCKLIHERDSDALTLFVPADHYIDDEDVAVRIFDNALEFASGSDALITFGIPPTFPSPDYGYVRRGEPLGSGEYKVERFVEKPDVETARGYISDGNYYWNSGMFVWKTNSLLKAISRYMPQTFDLLRGVQIDVDRGVSKESIEKFFDDVESISIDYGVMEKASNVVVFPFDAPWSDVGTWKGLADLAERFRIELPEEVQSYLRNNS